MHENNNMHLFHLNNATEFSWILLEKGTGSEGQLFLCQLTTDRAPVTLIDGERRLIQRIEAPFIMVLYNADYRYFIVW